MLSRFGLPQVERKQGQEGIMIEQSPQINTLRTKRYRDQPFFKA